MSNEEARSQETLVRRTLQLRFTLPTSDSTQLIAMIKAATPFYQMFGKAEVRLLQNVDDQTKFVQEIEYEAHEENPSPDMKACVEVFKESVKKLA